MFTYFKDVSNYVCKFNLEPKYPVFYHGIKYRYDFVCVWIKSQMHQHGLELDLYFILR